MLNEEEILLKKRKLIEEINDIKKQKKLIAELNIKKCFENKKKINEIEIESQDIIKELTIYNKNQNKNIENLIQEYNNIDKETTQIKFDFMKKLNKYEDNFFKSRLFLKDLFYKTDQRHVNNISFSKENIYKLSNNLENYLNRYNENKKIKILNKEVLNKMDIN